MYTYLVKLRHLLNTFIYITSVLQIVNTHCMRYIYGRGSRYIRYIHHGCHGDWVETVHTSSSKAAMSRLLEVQTIETNVTFWLWETGNK